MYPRFFKSLLSGFFFFAIGAWFGRTQTTGSHSSRKNRVHEDDFCNTSLEFTARSFYDR
jgi:hypothetical protein